MKKAISAIVLIVIVIAAFAGGFLIGKGNLTEPKANSITGVYQTEKGSTLVLYKDGTCQYANYGDHATWKQNGDTVQITVETHKAVTKGMKVYLSDSLSDAQIQSTITKFNAIANVESTQYLSEDGGYFQILFASPEGSNTYKEVYAQIITTPNIKIAEGIQETVVNTADYQAAVMENGLVLNEQFFQKVSN